MIRVCFPNCPSVFGLQTEKAEDITRYRNPKTQETWEFISDKKIHCNLLLANVVVLACVFRIHFRIFSLAMGDFIYAGYHIAKRKSLLQKQIWCISMLQNKTDVKAPNNFCCLWAIESLKQLALNIIKITLYPLGLIGIFFGALYGNLVHAGDGRFIIGAIEKALARNEMSVNDSSKRLICLTFTNMNWGDFAFACFQTWEERSRYNFYAFAKVDYKPKDLFASLRRIQRELQQNYQFYENEKLQVFQKLTKYRKSEWCENNIIETSSVSVLAHRIFERLIELKKARESLSNGLIRNKDVSLAKESFVKLKDQIKYDLSMLELAHETPLVEVDYKSKDLLASLCRIQMEVQQNAEYYESEGIKIVEKMASYRKIKWSKENISEKSGVSHVAHLLLDDLIALKRDRESLTKALQNKENIPKKQKNALNSLKERINAGLESLEEVSKTPLEEFEFVEEKS